MTIIVVHF